MKIFARLSCIVLVLSSVCMGITDGDRHRISEIKKLNAPPRNSSIRSIEGSCSRWSKRFLTKRYSIPLGIKHVMLPAKDSSDMDKMRLRYQVQQESVTITHSPCIFHIALENIEGLDSAASADECKAMVLKVVSLVFNGGANLEHTDVSKFEGQFVGELKKTERSDKQYPWLDSVQWWYDGKQIGFAFIKYRGVQTSAMISWDSMFNQGWFKHSF